MGKVLLSASFLFLSAFTFQHFKVWRAMGGQLGRNDRRPSSSGVGEGVRSSSALGRGGSCRPEASAGEQWLLITLKFEQVTDLEFLQLLLASVLLS